MPKFLTTAGLNFYLEELLKQADKEIVRLERELRTEQPLRAEGDACLACLVVRGHRGMLGLKRGEPALLLVRLEAPHAARCGGLAARRLAELLQHLLRGQDAVLEFAPQAGAALLDRIDLALASNADRVVLPGREAPRSAELALELVSLPTRAEPREEGSLRHAVQLGVRAKQRSLLRRKLQARLVGKGDGSHVTCDLPLPRQFTVIHDRILSLCPAWQ